MSGAECPAFGQLACAPARYNPRGYLRVDRELAVALHVKNRSYLLIELLPDAFCDQHRGSGHPVSGRHADTHRGRRTVPKPR